MVAGNVPNPAGSNDPARRCFFKVIATIVAVASFASWGMCAKVQCATQQAFTLIELIVVIAIIADPPVIFHNGRSTFDVFKGKYRV